MTVLDDGRDNTYREAWWRAFLTSPGLPSGARLVGVVISTHSRANGLRAVVSAEMIAAETGAGESTVRRHVHWLRVHGWVVRTVQGGRDGSGRVRANEYALTISTAQSGEQLSGLSTNQSGEQLSVVSTARSVVSTARSDVSTAHSGERPPSSSPRNTPRRPRRVWNAPAPASAFPPGATRLETW